jgi:hypothetical protein
MHNQLFESALGIGTPWSVKSVEFDLPAKRLVVLIDFTPGTRFALPGHEGLHPVYDTITKEYRHLNFFQHQCHLRVRTPRVRFCPAARFGWSNRNSPVGSRGSHCSTKRCC